MASETRHSLSIEAGCLGFCGKHVDRHRDRIAGVHVEPCPAGGVIAVGTDGRTLLAIHDPNGSVSSPMTVIASDDFWEMCRKRPDVAISTASLTDGFWLIGNGVAERATFPSESFPDWRAVSPAIPQTATPSRTIQARFVSRFEGVAKWLADEPCAGVSLRFGEGGAATYVGLPGTRAYGLVMPLREEPPLAVEYPTWVRATTVSAAA